MQPTTREQLHHLIDSLPTEELAEAARLLQQLAGMLEQPAQPLLQEPAQEDPAIGFFSAASDFAETSEDVLRANFGIRTSQGNERE